MVAITTTNPVALPAPRARVAPRRPLRVVGEGDESVAPRLRAGTLATVAVVAAVLLALAYLATSAPTTPGATGTPATLDAHVVSEGETLWSIAQEIAPAGEAATYVERLADANGGATVVVGQALTVPVP